MSSERFQLPSQGLTSTIIPCLWWLFSASFLEVTSNPQKDISWSNPLRQIVTSDFFDIFWGQITLHEWIYIYIMIHIQYICMCIIYIDPLYIPQSTPLVTKPKYLPRTSLQVSTFHLATSCRALFAAAGLSLLTRLANSFMALPTWTCWTMGTMGMMMSNWGEASKKRSLSGKKSVFEPGKKNRWTNSLV